MITETWIKGNITKTMEVYPDKDWYYGFVDNGAWLLPVSRYHLINDGWKQVLPGGSLKYTFKKD